MTDAVAIADPSALPPLREVIARHGLAARKRLGQHFLLDLNLTGRIARAAGDLDDGTVIEIGPGPGGLTRALLEAGARRVVAIERDPRCLAALGELAARYPGRLDVVEGDALEIDPADAGGPRRADRRQPALQRRDGAAAAAGCDRIDAYESLTLMFQKEVAERLVAAPRTTAYGRLSVLAQWLCEPQMLFDLPPARLRAAAQGDLDASSRWSPRARAAGRRPRSPLLERVTAAAFGQRRKMLRSSLKTLGVAAEAAAGRRRHRRRRARAEELSVGEFCALARVLLDGRAR